MAASSSRSRQTTLLRPVAFTGRGTHSDAPASLTISPAEAGSGVLFLPASSERPVAASWRNVSATQLRTEISQGCARVATIEHLMAALHGLGVDNAIVELDGPEVPALDGSASPFVSAILDAGLKRLSARRRVIRIRETLRVCDGAAWAELSPTRRAELQLDVEIAFPGPPGRQRLALTLSPESFAREIAPARSFGFLSDAERLWRQGLALGASLENCVVLDGERVLNPQGLRFADEFVRHKALDVIGDLALAGAPIQGAFRSYRGGHRLNLALVAKLMQTPSAYEAIGDSSAAAVAVAKVHGRVAP